MSRSRWTSRPKLACRPLAKDDCAGRDGVVRSGRAAGHHGTLRGGQEFAARRAIGAQDCGLWSGSICLNSRSNGEGNATDVILLRAGRHADGHSNCARDVRFIADLQMPPSGGGRIPLRPMMRAGVAWRRCCWRSGSKVCRRRRGRQRRRAWHLGWAAQASVDRHGLLTSSRIPPRRAHVGPGHRRRPVALRVLGRLAKTARALVVATIHQPRSDIFAMFDQLLLMSAGRIAFQGAAASVQDHLTHWPPVSHRIGTSRTTLSTLSPTRRKPRTVG